MKTHGTWIPVAALALCAWAASALGGVEVEVGNGDKVTATIDPADEYETFFFRAPEGSQIAVKAKALKGGPSLDVALYGPDDDPLDFGTGKAVNLTNVLAEVGGLFTVVVSSADLESTGDYSLAISWKAPTTFTGSFDVPAGESDVLPFNADEGSTVTLSVKPGKGFASDGVLASLTPPEGPEVLLVGTKSKQTLAETGVYSLAFSNVGDDGELIVTAKVKPPKPLKRKIALTSKVIGSGNPDGDTAFASVVGLSGGLVSVPEVDEGEPGFELTGSSVLLPPNALPAATAIVIATAPALVPPGDGTGAGTTVFFGPEGAKFDAAATVTIPYDAAFDAMTDTLVIFTRDAKGKIQPVPPPYTFDTVAHTVSFATSHFSSFRAVMPGGGSTTAMLTLASGIPDPRDVTLALDDSGSSQPVLYYVAGGSARTVIALRADPTPTTQFLTKEVWAGGGALTADGTPRQQFDFGGDVVSVYVSQLGDGTVWVATPTKVFRVATNGNVTHVAGTGSSLDDGDNGPALQASFVNISAVIASADETIYVADRGAFRVRVIDPATQTITTFAGTGVQGVGGDGLALDSTNLLIPNDMEFADDGGIYLADGARLRHLTPPATGPGVNTTVAGSSSGVTGSSGDGGSLTAARFREIAGVSVYFDPFDPTAVKLVVSDTQDSTLRVLDLDDDRVTLIAGRHGEFGNAPDFSPADGLIATPLGVDGRLGQVTFVDAENGKIRTRLLTGP